MKITHIVEYSLKIINPKINNHKLTFSSLKPIFHMWCVFKAVEGTLCIDVKQIF